MPSGLESRHVINVANAQGHVFRVECDQYPPRAKAVFQLIREAFPADSGYRVTIARWDCGGHDVTSEMLDGTVLPASVTGVAR